MLSLTLSMSFSGCTNKEYVLKTPKCATIKLLKKVNHIEIKTNKFGGLDEANTQIIFSLVKQLRRVEDYYYSEVSRMNKINSKRQINVGNY